MLRIEFIMGMPVIVEILDHPGQKIFQKVFDYFRFVDDQFSPYKQNSEVTKLNDGRLSIKNISPEMKTILELAQKTKGQTNGYFDISTSENTKYFNPSGIVKGWAIQNAAEILSDLGFTDYYVDAGGDIQTRGLNKKRKKWQIGIRNPFNRLENVKVVSLSGEGIATSGTYERGNHIYNPKGKISKDILSLTVIGPNVLEADRFATAAFAMGREGINFIDRQKGLEGYMIDANGIATMTKGFEKYART